MASIDNIKVGQVLWHKRSTFVPVKVIAIDREKQSVRIDYPGKPLHWVHERVIKSYRVNKPEAKK